MYRAEILTIFLEDRNYLISYHDRSALIFIIIFFMTLLYGRNIKISYSVFSKFKFLFFVLFLSILIAVFASNYGVFYISIIIFIKTKICVKYNISYL